MSDHVAIMRKSWGLIPKILDGRKKIESRWSINRVAPWGKVKIGDSVYFKNSGEAVSAKAVVSNILQFEDLNLKKIKDIFYRYGGEDGIASSNIESTIEWAKDKRYCTLIFLKDPERVRAFSINKKGFGNACAWMVVGEINKVRLI
jgi:hypothetical protein